MQFTPGCNEDDATTSSKPKQEEVLSRPLHAYPPLFSLLMMPPQPVCSGFLTAHSIPPHCRHHLWMEQSVPCCRWAPGLHCTACTGSQTKQTPVASRSKLIFQQPPSLEFTATVIRCCQQRRLCCAPVCAACLPVGLLLWFFFNYFLLLLFILRRIFVLNE